MRRGFLLTLACLALSVSPARAAPPAFAPAGELPGNSSMMDLSTGDVNGDGRQDVLMTTWWPGRITVYLARPGGGYDIAGPLAVPSYPTRPLVLDLDGDGRNDIVTAARPGGSVTVLRGTAAGDFVRTDYPGPPANPAINELNRAEAIAAADVTGDGRLDIAIASTTLRSLFVLEQTDGGLAAPVEYPGLFAHDIEAGDVTGDGRDDLVLAEGTVIKVLAALPGGGLAGPVSYPGFGQRLVVRDLDGDGNTDVVVAGWPISILLGKPGGGLAAKLERTLPRAPYELDAGDLNGDGQLDLAGVTGDDREVTGLLGGTFEPWRQGFAPRGYVARMTIADQDDDGRPDLVVEDDWSHGAIRVLMNQTPRIALGEATLTDPAELALPYTLPAFRAQVAELRVEVKRPRAEGFEPLELRDAAEAGTIRVREGQALAPGEWRIRVTAYGHDGQVLETAEAVKLIAAPAIPESPKPDPPPVDPVAAPRPVTAPASRPELRFASLAGRKSTRLLRLRLVHVPPGSAVTVRCARGCPARSLTLRRPGETVSLARFASRRLEAGTMIRITITEPAGTVRVATIRIRAGREPRVLGSLSRSA